MCGGNKIIEETTQFTIQIKKGTKDQDKILLKGYGDYNPVSKQNEDILLVIQQKKHRLKRKDNDLILEQVVNIRDALVGSVFEYKHLDDTFKFDIRLLELREIFNQLNYKEIDIDDENITFEKIVI